MSETVFEWTMKAETSAASLSKDELKRLEEAHEMGAHDVAAFHQQRKKQLNNLLDEIRGGLRERGYDFRKA